MNKKDNEVIRRLAQTPAVKALTADLDRLGIKYEIIPIHHQEGAQFGDFTMHKKEQK